MTLSSCRRLWLRSTAPLRFPAIWLSLDLSAGVDRLLLLLLLLSLVLVCLLFLVSSRLGSAPLPLLAVVAASASGVERGGGSFFWAFEFPEVGAITFPDPFRRLSVPPLAGLEGQGCGALGGRGAAGWLLSAFPQHPSTFQCSAPNAFLQLHFHQGCCSGGGHLGPRCQGCCGACSSPFSRLLQPSVRSVEDLGVLASSHRPLPSQSLCGRVSLSDGNHPVCSPLGASGGLDGLHRSQGCVSAGACPSCFSSSSTLRLQGQRLSVQGSMLWPLHGSAGLHQGHGSCFRHSPFYGDPHEALPRRLARPVSLSRIPRAGFVDSPPPLSRVGDCRQSPKVQPRSITGCPVSRSDHRRPIFQGFSIARTCLQASVNSRRISVLRLASRCWAFFLRWLTSFLAAVCECDLSSFASTSRGIVWISRLRCR